MFANVTAASGGETPGIELYGDGVGSMIPNHFRGDLRVRPDRGKERFDIRFGFWTWSTRPLTFDHRLELFELCVSHTDGPGLCVTKSVVSAMVPYGCTIAFPECAQSPPHAAS